jgi:lipoate-protein ligase A
MALDEALLESTAGGSLPALRLYGWEPPAVSVGYFQGLAEEVDIDACRRLGFDLVRRISGGGAVLHKSELTYSMAMPLNHPLAGADLNDSYRILCTGLVEALRLLGLSAFFSGINDILAVRQGGAAAEGRKVSGNAQTRRLGCLLQHGTVLLDNDTGIMFEVLKVPREKIKGKLIGKASERVTTLRDLLGRSVSFEEAAAAVSAGFQNALDLEYRAEAPSPREEARAAALARSRFSTRKWIYKR